MVLENCCAEAITYVYKSFGAGLGRRGGATGSETFGWQLSADIHVNKQINTYVTYIYTYIDVHTYVYTYIDIYMHVPEEIQAHKKINEYTCIYTPYMRICLYVYACAFPSVCVYIYTCTSVCNIFDVGKNLDIPTCVQGPEFEYGSRDLFSS